MVLKEAPLPEDIRKLGAEGVNKIWRNAKLRGNKGGLENKDTCSLIILDVMMPDMDGVQLYPETCALVAGGGIFDYKFYFIDKNFLFC